MPTPVSAARQCLTDEAARALDDAVSVARRRCHAQTTSLHAVSALLSLPSSALRDAASRARSCAYPPRLQFRALELSVGVSLDRLPSGKPSSSGDDNNEPPVSNSLMAAIKRSQANQRRHPDSFHLHQIHTHHQPPSILKVELKYFILSILDDPIVSRVFAEAGFGSCDIKLAIMHPPLAHQPSRFSRSRCPPIFLCNLTDSDAGHRNFTFPFSNGGDDDANCRRIAEVLTKKTGRNPLLIGVYAADSLRSFTDCVQRCKSEVLPAEISGLRVVCIGKEVSEFLAGNGNREKMKLKFEEVFGMVQSCSGPGMVVNYGELSGLISEEEEGDDDDDDDMSFVVSQLTNLFKLYSGKLWLIGAAGSYEMYEKFVARFPAIEKDWDLHLLPITSKSPVDAFGAKSSLMGSFVPFGGFFPPQSNFSSQLSSLNQLFTRCRQCTEKYEQEVAAIWKPGSASVTGCHSESSLHLPMTELDAKGKEFDVFKTRDERSTLSDKVIGLQKKWNEICRLHQRQLFPKLDISQTRHGISFESALFAFDHERSGEEPSSVTGERSVLVNPCLSRDLQTNLNTKQGRQVSETFNSHTDHFQPKIVTGASWSIESESLQFFSKTVPKPKECLHSDNVLPSPHISVTTDLGLGTLYASASENKRKVSELETQKVCIQHLTGSNLAEFRRLNNNPSRSPGFSDPNSGQPLDMREFKSLWNALNEKVSWQGKATSSVVETVLRCRTGGGRRRSSNSRGDIWLTLLGPDVIGKRKVSLALAELMFGSRENLISVDFGSQDRGRQSNSLFACKGLDGYDERFRGTTVVDYVAGELRKKPSSVVLIENVDRADIRVKSCLFQAIMTGKFPDSHGRQITIHNTIFITTWKNKKGGKTSNAVDEQTEFSEERILTAKNCRMQIQIADFTSNVSELNNMNVRITTARGSSSLSFLKKRKLAISSESADRETNSEMPKKASSSSSMSHLDLNLPVEEVETSDGDADCDSDPISEDSEAWLDEFLEQVDEKVVFKPYDFDEAAERVVKEINSQLKRVFGNEVVLEIEYKIMVQMLAANWLAEKKRGMEEWVENVLHKSFVEAKERYQISCGSVMKLVCREEEEKEEEAGGIFLPARIKIN